MNTPGWHDPGNDPTVHIPPRGAAPGPGPAWHPGPVPNPVHAHPQQWPPAVPPGGYGSGHPWPTGPGAPQGGKRRRTVLISAAVVALVVAVVAVAIVFVFRGKQTSESVTATPVSTSASPAPEEPNLPPIPVSALSGLLLSMPEAAAVAGSATMAGNGEYGDKIYEAMADEPLVDASCMSLSPGLEPAYQGSGFTASRQQFLQGQSADRKVVQTVVSFADAASAHKHLTATAAKWNACANRSINLATVGADPNFWQVGAVTESDDMVIAARLEEGGNGWACRSGLAARNNIVIDVAVCGENLPDSAATDFIEKVSAKIDGTHK